MSGCSTLKVVCRLRPLTETERRASTVPAVTASAERAEVVVNTSPPGSGRQVKSAFQFDNVLSAFSSQSDLFNATVKPLVHDICEGYTGVIFAYGQMGSGKTHTVEGTDGKDGRGLTARGAEAIMQSLTTGGYSLASMTVSCLEVYNEELSDLLSPSRQAKVELKDGEHGAVCDGLTEVKVAGLADMLDVMRSVQERRRVIDAQMPGRSSRSHYVFTFTVVSRRQVPGGEYENCGKLHLVDLAGSDAVKKAQGTSPRENLGSERERRNINQSLLTLKRVVAACHDSESITRVPYRESKLTRLLQYALSGECHTVMIATVSPAQVAVDETIATLTYAEQVMGKSRRSPRQQSGRPTTPRGGPSPCQTTSTSPTLTTPTTTAAVHTPVLSQTPLPAQNREAPPTSIKSKRAAEQDESCKQQLRELQVKYATVAGQLESLRQAEAKSKQRETETSSRMQAEARELTGVAKQRCEALVDASRQAAARLVAASDDGQRAQDSSLEAMVQLSSTLQQMLRDVAGIVRDGAHQLTESMSSAVVKACEAAAAELTEANGRLTAIEGAATKSSKLSSDTLSQVNKSVSSSSARMREQADVVRKLLKGRSEVLSSGVRAVARDLGIAEKNATAAEAAFAERLQNNIGRPLLSLGEVVHAASVACDSHTTSLDRASSGAAAEANAAAARRSAMRGELQLLAEAHSASAQSMHPALQGLEGLGKALAKEASGTSETLAMVAEELGQSKKNLGDICTCGESAWGLSAKASDDVFAAAWAEADKLSVAVHEAFGDDAITSRMDLVSDPKQVASVSTLSRKLCIVLSALLCARGTIEAEVASLRQQRRDEEEILGLLAQQRESLASDCARAEATLGSLAKQLEVSRKGMTDLAEEQAIKREGILKAVTSGVETLLRTEMAELEKRLLSRSAAVQDALAAATEHCQASSSVVREAQTRGDHLAGEAEQQAKAWSLGANSACDGIVAAQESSELACKELEGAAHECMGRLATALKHFQATQGSSKAQWASASEASGTAVRTWRERTQKVAAHLDDTLSQVREAADDLSAVHEETSTQLRAVTRQTTTRMGDDDRQSTAINALMSRQEEQESVDAQAEAERKQSLVALAHGAEAIAAEVVRCGPLVARLGEVADSLAAEVTAEGRSQRKAIDGARITVENLPLQCEALLAPGADGSPLDALQELCGAGDEMARTGVKGLSDVAESTSSMATSIAGLVQAQRCGLATFMNNESEERWMELESFQEKKLKSVEMSVHTTAERGMAAVTDASQQAEEARQKAGTFRGKSRSELDGMLTQLTSSLTDLQKTWRNGLGIEPLST